MTKLKAEQNIVILGASGWVGKNFLNSLSSFENIELFLYSFKDSKNLKTKNGKTYCTKPIQELSKLEIEKVDILVDLAFPTQDKIAYLGDLKYLDIIKNLENIKSSFLKAYVPRNVFVLSSGAVYWEKDQENLYSKSKKEQEEFYHDYFKNNKNNVHILRLFGLVADYFTYDNNYAFTSFIKQALENKTIHINSNFYVYRSYITFSDMFQYFEYSMMNEINNQFKIFDACSDTFEIQTLAEIISKIIPAKVSRSKIINSDNVYTGDCTFFKAFLSSRNINTTFTEEKLRKELGKT